MKFEISPVEWQLCSLAVLAVIVLGALLTDVRSRRIPNELVVLALGAGFFSHMVGPVDGSGGLLSNQPGALGVQGAFLGALTGFAIFLPLYVLRAMGAGDVKLMAGIGSFAGPAGALNLVLFIFIMGGMLALVRMCWTGSTRRVLGNVIPMVLAATDVNGRSQIRPPPRSVDGMPYAVAMAAGLLTYGAWLWLGGSPPFRF